MVLRYQQSDAAAQALGIAIQPFGVREPDVVERDPPATARFRRLFGVTVPFRRVGRIFRVVFLACIFIVPGSYSIP
jgi:hypothetical protein